jgi:hypothetical protein
MEELQLIVVEKIKPVELFTDKSMLDLLLSEVRTKVMQIVPDMSTATGRKDIASTAYQIARGKTKPKPSRMPKTVPLPPQSWNVSRKNQLKPLPELPQRRKQPTQNTGPRLTPRPCVLSKESVALLKNKHRGLLMQSPTAPCRMLQ